MGEENQNIEEITALRNHKHYSLIASLRHEEHPDLETNKRLLINNKNSYGPRAFQSHPHRI